MLAIEAGLGSFAASSGGSPAADACLMLAGAIAGLSMAGVAPSESIDPHAPESLTGEFITRELRALKRARS
eukprot:XP_001704212.1 Hypothetical protein GL50803_28587 [Giardia lamblia ATCC 50803]